SHLADELLLHGYRVRVLDNLDAQVHGAEGEWPEYLDQEVELLRGDVRDAKAVRNALRGVDAVFHFAAAVGVGQSMYQIERYTDVNNRGTAVLLEALSREPVGRLIVASSMSIYGEALVPLVTPESKAPHPSSVYALSKMDQERLCLMIGEAYGIPTVALRFFN